MRNTLLKTIALGLLLATSARAGTTFINFDIDPTGTGLYQDIGSGQWRGTGGNPATGGYLSITDALNGQRATLIFKDFDTNLIVKAFSFSMDVRIGNGTAQPADGFSVNYARAGDPVLVLANGNGFAASPTGEANLPEEGTQTGLAVGFDSWFSGGADVIGISVRVDNVILTNVAKPTLNGACGDLTSLQTGPVDGTGSPDVLCWQPFTVNLDEDGTLDITYKGAIVTTNFPTSYFPSAGRLVFAGRTGGANQNHHVDNISITTIAADKPVVTGIQSSAAGFTVQILDQSTSVNTNTIAIKLDGNTVVATSITKVGTTTFVAYNQFPTLLAANSTHSVQVDFQDSAGAPITRTLSFTVPAYGTLQAGYALTGVDTTKAGFLARIHQLSIGRAPGDANTIAQAERQLANGFIDPATGTPYPNRADLTAAVNGFFVDDNVINWNQDCCLGTDIGNFRDISTPPFPDEPIPGIPGLDLSTDNVAAEILMYLDLKAGVYRFGVNSDDGFKFSASRAVGDVLGQVLGSFNTGRGSSDTIFDFVAPVDGVYPFRLAWWEGGGGANLELFAVNLTTGQKFLINDLSAATPIRAYRESTVTRPYVSRVLPSANYGFAFADADVVVDITDGTIPVNASPISLTLNGTDVTGTPTKTGNVTTIKRTGSLSNLLASGANNLTLMYSFTDGANTVNVTNTWSFTVVPYKVIPAANKVAPGSVTLTDLGFKALAKQLDRSGDTNQGNGGRLFTGDQNRMPRPEIQLANGDINPTNGLPYPNLAQAGPNPDGTFDVLDVLNFNSNPSGGNSGVFRVNKPAPLAVAPYNTYQDAEMPGLPGLGTSITGTIQGIENYVAEFVTYLDLKAGTYVMAVNSDDGFVAISGLDPHDTLGTMVGFANIGRGNAEPLPAPSTTAANTVPTPGTSGGNSAFGVVVPEDGIYPFRVLFWQGGGGVNLEFSSVDKGSGQEALINDTSTPWAVKAYRTYTGPARPWVKFSVSPEPWDNRVQQAGPGPLLTYGRTRNSVSGSDIYNNNDVQRPWADVRIGGVVANGVGSTLGLLLDGTPVTPTLTINGSDVTVSYKPSPPLASGSSHTASLIYGGTTNSWPFIVQTYTNLNASDAQPLNSGDPSAAGLRVKMTQLATTPANQNTVGRAEAQLAGTLGADVSMPGPGSNGTYIYPGIINWNNNVNANHTGNPLGNFQANNYGAGTGWPFPFYADEPIPGVPNTTTNAANAYTDNLAAEIFGYLKFDNAGYYRFGVNSDDGFKVQVGTPGQTNGTIIFTIDVGKGSSDIPFSFTVPQPGLYPIRLVYYNGGGGANLEYFSYNDTGTKIPINDTNNPAAIKAYYNIITTPQLQFTSVSASGGSVTINWTGSNWRLQEASALTGNPGDWGDVSPQPGGNTITVSAAAAAQKFYRLISP
jgi:hypothetical protein